MESFLCLGLTGSRAYLFLPSNVSLRRRSEIIFSELRSFVERLSSAESVFYVRYDQPTPTQPAILRIYYPGDKWFSFCVQNV